MTFLNAGPGDVFAPCAARGQATLSKETARSLELSVPPRNNPAVERHLRRSLCVSLGVLALASGCGGDDDRSSAEATETERSSSGTTSSRTPAISLRGRIIFTRAGGAFGDETIFIANADGTDEFQLTEPGVHCCPRITRDGSHILFAAQGPNERITTATMTPEKTDYVEIPLPDETINLGPGAWSPDGRSIAFQGWDEQNPGRDGIYIGSSGGQDLKRVTTAKVGADIPGDYSPDGRQLAFFREREDTQGVGSVWVVNVDGTGVKRLTPREFMAGLGGVRWSPDGSKILLQSASTEDVGALWTVEPDGSGFKRLFVDSEGRFAISPTWSPSGDQIMFALDPIADAYSHPVNALYVINADGTGLTPVIETPDFKREPDWVP